MDYITSKINNSYSVVTCIHYYSDAKKICNQHRSTCHKSKASARRISDGRRMFFAAPIANGTKVTSKQYGEGIVLSTDNYGVMQIRFKTDTIPFSYPQSVRCGSIRIAS